MAVTSVHPSTVLQETWQRATRDPAYGAYTLLRLGFIALPLLMGLDKFFNLMTNWPGYLAPWIVAIIPMSAQHAMFVVGAVEIVAAVAMIIKPRYAAYIVAAWLAGIVIDLLSYSGFYDIALRDFGLMLAALTLARLASVYDPAWHRARSAAPTGRVTEPSPVRK